MAANAPKFVRLLLLVAGRRKRLADVPVGLTDDTATAPSMTYAWLISNRRLNRPVKAPVGAFGLRRASHHVFQISGRSKSGHGPPSNLSHGDHRNREIPGKHAENVDTGQSYFCALAVQAPVGHLEVLRSARQRLLPQTLSLPLSWRNPHYI